MNSLPKTVTGQRRDCDLNPGCARVQRANHLATEPPTAVATKCAMNEP